MADIVYESTKDLMAWVVNVDRGQARAFLDKVVDAAAKTNVQILVMRSDMVFGIEHIRSALYHAKKAMEDQRNSSDSLAMESLLYASGERQLSSAMKKMSVDQTTEEIVIAKLSRGDLEVSDSWKTYDSSPADGENLKRFGITHEELETIGDRSPIDLVLEKVAAVDIIKK